MGQHPTMPSVQTANEWATFSGQFTDTKGGAGTQHPPPQKDDSDILAACQTPAALTPYWQARHEEAAGKPHNDDDTAQMRDVILDILMRLQLSIGTVQRRQRTPESRRRQNDRWGREHARRRRNKTEIKVDPSKPADGW
ncbi:hypothetical protein V500_06447 [Pseudogymnoascus sp. VKM F-4518 (FW-2643)]|nr:hypothetical protein V500_06447 [Pseudogymnoascus sp. VKM F-4518 (FW-2643)]